MNFWREQPPRLPLEQMQNHSSADGGDDLGHIGGICACDSVAELRSNTAMDAARDDDEVVIFKGRILAEIYDGYRVYPTEIVARMTVRDFWNRLSSEPEVLTALEDWS